VDKQIGLNEQQRTNTTNHQYENAHTDDWLYLFVVDNLLNVVYVFIGLCCQTSPCCLTWWGEPGEIENCLDDWPPSTALTLLVGSSGL